MVKPDYRHLKNPYSDRKESKAREIKRSLTHRARLRKNYFKLLEKEGEINNVNSISVSENDENSAKDVIEDQDSKLHNEIRPKEIYKRNPIAPKQKMTFADRAQLVKERKKKDRTAKLNAIKEKRNEAAKKEDDRQLKRDYLTQKTRRGQPLMGPRINNLLEKIQKEAK